MRTFGRCEMPWDERLEVARLPHDRVEADVTVQIVNPRQCGSWGNCAAFDLTSNHVEIQ